MRVCIQRESVGAAKKQNDIAMSIRASIQFRFRYFRCSLICGFLVPFGFTNLQQVYFIILTNILELAHNSVLEVYALSRRYATGVSL